MRLVRQDVMKSMGIKVSQKLSVEEDETKLIHHVLSVTILFHFFSVVFVVDEVKW